MESIDKIISTKTMSEVSKQVLPDFQEQIITTWADSAGQRIRKGHPSLILLASVHIVNIIRKNTYDHFSNRKIILSNLTPTHN